MNNEIYIRRKNKIYLKPGDNTYTNFPLIGAMVKNIETLGYTLSAELLHILQTISATELEAFYFKLVDVLKKLKGSHVKYKPMYPNFPQQVMEADEAELLINAIIHYMTFGSLRPHYEKYERLPLFDQTKTTKLELGTEEEFNTIFLHLLQSKTSLSDIDKKDLEWWIINDGAKENLPSEIPLKENVALIGKLILEHSPMPDLNYLKQQFKTATDVLRLITSMSNGDISLSANVKYRSFRRKERRILLELLENCGYIEEDMLRYKNRWIRIGERLHPSEYTYIKVKTAFEKIRNGDKIPTYGSKVAYSIEHGDYKTILALLKKRPGEFARKLDHLLRNSEEETLILNAFREVADEVSTPVLLQVREHFIHRNDISDSRVIFPKGNVAKAICIENTLPPMKDTICMTIVLICENALMNTYRRKPLLGNVYLSEEYRHYLVPFSQRSASKALKTIVRGSKLPLDKSTNTIRTFIWWKNGKSRVDIDLSAVLLDDQWNYLEHVSYTNLRSVKYNMYHSGDITDAPNGACEFIDLDLAYLEKQKVGYVVMNVFSYTNQAYCDLPECFAGWMEREHPNSGEIFEAKTVKNKIDLASKTRICIPMILDVMNREIIWCDMGLRKNPNWNNNLEANKHSIAAACKGMVEMKKPNLHDLISLHIKARGIKCDNKEMADVIFDIEDGITPFDTDIFMGEYL